MSGGETSFSDNNNLLNDPNIMVVGPGETCSSTSCYGGMIQMKVSGVEDTVTTEKGEEMRPTKIVDLPVTHYSFFLLVWPPRFQSLLIMGWCSSIPEHML